ncbi:hypothetical protein [Citricoccus sp. K5]|uniref:hypothetical protein n=1 Tax=Citricoccus sp. K5 TaxID=2653135 RepID=UPI0012F0DDD0|nr:hypothetical protein [Citricoccus sp. K5]VXB90131.1 conserved hypothetical protein [Citricoccus sp. K5]
MKIITPPAVMAEADRHDQAFLESLMASYRRAYLARDAGSLPVTPDVRFTENNVELPFPEASWDAVTDEVGPAMTFSDPATGNVAAFTAILMNGTPGFLTIRIKVVKGRITEIEHMLSTKRGVSGPPTPFGKVEELTHQEGISDPLPQGTEGCRAEVLNVGDGYFQTLSRNDGTLYTSFAENCFRIENGYQAAPQGAAKDFLLGRWRFNERVRREWIMVDEVRGICLARGFIDHKGLLLSYELTDGSFRESPFQEPHTWSFLEMFKVKSGEIAAIEATFIGSPYYSRSPWASEREDQDLNQDWVGGAVRLADAWTVRA